MVMFQRAVVLLRTEIIGFLSHFGATMKSWPQMPTGVGMMALPAPSQVGQPHSFTLRVPEILGIEQQRMRESQCQGLAPEKGRFPNEMTSHCQDQCQEDDALATNLPLGPMWVMGHGKRNSDLVLASKKKASRKRPKAARPLAKPTGLWENPIT